MFEPVPGSVRFPDLEREIGQFWKSRKIYEKSLAARSGAPRFVFYEGPPTANGLPHPGHCLTRVIKDVFPRYRTMRGYLCQRKAGWDTHGLPVEVEVSKEQNLNDIFSRLSAQGIEVLSMRNKVNRLEEIFMRLVEARGEGRAATASGSAAQGSAQGGAAAASSGAAKAVGGGRS